MNPQLLIFDLDGTLVDARGDLTASVNYVRAQFGLEPLSFETVTGFIGEGARKLVERSIRGTDINLEEALNMYRDYYGNHLFDYTTCYPGVQEGIPRLVEAGHTLALLTNKPGDPSRAILDHFGLSPYFMAVLGGGDLPALKPEPDGVFFCMEKSGISADSTWMIGDHCTDLSVARRAGVRSVFAAYGFGDPKGLEPDHSVQSFPELTDFFIRS